MKRYLVFCYEEFYPNGGWDDFTGDYDSIGEAAQSIIEDEYLIVHIVDTNNPAIVLDRNGKERREEDRYRWIGNPKRWKKE